jgi:hypothetical protein
MRHLLDQKMQEKGRKKYRLKSPKVSRRNAGSFNLNNILIFLDHFTTESIVLIVSTLSDSSIKRSRGIFFGSVAYGWVISEWATS